MRIVPHLALTPTDKAIAITADDRDPVGNMSHRYNVAVVDPQPGGSSDLDLGQTLRFQHGPISEAGINGLTNETLLAILIDRLEGAQAGPFACVYNADALAACRTASERLADRTRDRMGRGVEGVYKP
jgi:hypothetical protein